MTTIIFCDVVEHAPRFSLYEHRKHAWTAALGELDHSSSPTSIAEARASIEPWSRAVPKKKPLDVSGFGALRSG